MKTKVKPGSMEWTASNVKGFCGKQLLGMDNGSVKLVRVEPQSDYPLNRHPDKTEYAYVVDGNLEFTIDNEAYHGAPGDFFIFLAMIMYAIHNRTNEPGTLLVGAIIETKQ
ncbi:MAG: cupin domain-containing protein [Cyclobacteriaceae bacterium]|nr:cupin domain-containing protein [Cyclobacteriaceae bacterium]